MTWDDVVRAAIAAEFARAVADAIRRQEQKP